MNWSEYQQLFPRYKSLAYHLYNDEAPKGVKDALKNNKYAIDMWEANKLKRELDSDEMREFFIGPHLAVIVRSGANELWFCPTPWMCEDEDGARFIGYLKDDKTVEKAKNLYSELLRKKKNEYN